MNTLTIKLGVVARVKEGIVGIVCSKETKPEEGWIDEQLDSQEIRELGHTEWWGILVFGGGYALSPGPMLKYLREATFDDFLAAVDTAKTSGRERLAKIFPVYVDRVLAERQSREA